MKQLQRRADLGYYASVKQGCGTPPAEQQRGCACMLTAGRGSCARSEHALRFIQPWRDSRGQRPHTQL